MINYFGTMKKTDRTILYNVTRFTDEQTDHRSIKNKWTNLQKTYDISKKGIMAKIP